MVETYAELEKEKIKQELEARRQKEKSIFANIPNSLKVLGIGIILLLAWTYFSSGESCASGSFLIKDKCYQCPLVNMELTPDATSCWTTLESDGTCLNQTYFNKEKNYCEGYPTITAPKQGIDLKTILIIGGIVVLAYYLFQSQTYSQKELTHQELLAWLEKHIKDMQSTPFGMQEYQLDPRWQISLLEECDIPEHTNQGEGFFRKDLKYFVIKAENPNTLLAKKFYVALNIYSGDLKMLKCIGEDSNMLDIHDVYVQPSQQDKADAFREKWRAKEGLEKK